MARLQARPRSRPQLVVGVLLALVAVLGLGRAHVARASQLIDRNAQGVTLMVNARGEAMITYRKGTAVRHVLAWGAIDAADPSEDASQVAFKLDYSGGYGKYHRLRYWQAPGWGCRPYAGPALAWAVTACEAPDGSYWALQSWQRGLPDLGLAPTAAQTSWDLDLSHWRGALPVLSITVDWSYRKFDHLFGTLQYEGAGVFGFHSTSTGVPLDQFGRNIYVDTFDSAYGPGWRRENSFLTHRTAGSFCYGFYPHGSRPSGKGTQYRASVIGPGVTPDLMWEGAAPGRFDPQQEATSLALEKQLGDRLCTV
ncbi:MAG TPA: hypothetical protein VH063_10400 [Gaiellaceae bacterium]|jgi:hypothetical protein|nr:hypothetical protein [Gaiellaceae bacterium]